MGLSSLPQAVDGGPGGRRLALSNVSWRDDREARSELEENYGSADQVRERSRCRTWWRSRGGS